jgi:hypothetical protein
VRPAGVLTFQASWAQWSSTAEDRPRDESVRPHPPKVSRRTLVAAWWVETTQGRQLPQRHADGVL